MGSPIYCYKEILKDFILCNHKLKKDYEEIKKNLCNQTIEELENTSLKYYNTNKNYAIFMMGVCTSHFLDEWQENNDNGQLILSVGGNSLYLNNKDIDKLIKNLKQMKIYGEIKNEE